jgi:hypothetical protein
VQDFSSAKKIKLRAADGTVIDYTVTVYALFDGVDSLAGLYEYTDWTRAENPAPMPNPAKPLYIALAGFTGFNEVPPVTRHPGITYPENELYDYTMCTFSIMRIMGVESQVVSGVPLPGYVHNQYIALDVSALSDEALSSYSCPFGDEVGYTDGPFARVTSIRLPLNLKKLSNSLFQGNEILSSIDLPEGLEDIGYASFAGMKNLKSIKLPPNLKTIDRYAFIDTGLESIELPEGLETIAECAFANTQLQTITLPSTVKALGNGVFSGIKTLKYADFSKSKISTLANNRELANSYTFSNDINLEEVYLPQTLTELPQFTVGLFYGRNNLSKLVIYAEVPPKLPKDYKIVNSGSGIDFAYEQNANFPDTFKIYVPDASVDAYKTATHEVVNGQGNTVTYDGWVQYADKIYPISELGGAQ